MLRHSGERPPDPQKIRLLALAGVVACAVALPLAVASAGPVGDEGRTVVRAPAREAVRSSPREEDAKALSPAPTESPLLLGLGLATAVRCGPELSSPEGIEAQTCVLTQGQDTWARSYYRNATGEILDSALTLMKPDGRTLQLHCAVGSEDEPGMCETPRERTEGEPTAYAAVAEFAAKSGRGPLLLRAGSESEDGPESGSGGNSGASAIS